MNTADWLKAACEDADRRGLSELKPLLEGLAKATEALRRARWNLEASGRTEAK
jgi:hypothetical protein